MKRILSKLPASQLHLATRIVSVKASRHHVVELTTASGETSIYDHIIFACHSDTALNILRAGGTLTHEEHTILGAFEWTKNVAVLHNDSAVSTLPSSVCACDLTTRTSISSCRNGVLPGRVGTASLSLGQRKTDRWRHKFPCKVFRDNSTFLC